MTHTDVNLQNIATDTAEGDIACGELISSVREMETHYRKVYAQYQSAQQAHHTLVRSVVRALATPHAPWVIQRESRRERDRGKDIWTDASTRRFSDAGKALRYWRFASATGEDALDLRRGERFRIWNLHTQDVIYSEIIKISAPSVPGAP